jgi:hypothetical protein
MSGTKSVYKMISEVSAELVKDGIAKNQRNQQGSGYNFRGIDDVFNSLAPILARVGLVVLPRCIDRQVVERSSAAGKALFYVTVKVEFDLVSSEDSSKHTVVTYGEAMDSGDKATNKAMSAAYKYAAFQTFCIPTEGDNDADSSTHEVAFTKLNGGQIVDIMSLAEEVGVDVEKVCEFYKVSAIKDISASAFNSIIRSLEKKRT